MERKQWHFPSTYHKHNAPSGVSFNCTDDLACCPLPIPACAAHEVEVVWASAAVHALTSPGLCRGGLWGVTYVLVVEGGLDGWKLLFLLLNEMDVLSYIYIIFFSV